MDGIGYAIFIYIYIYTWWFYRVTKSPLTSHREAGSKHLVERSSRVAASRDAGRIVFITYIPAYAGIFIIIYTIIMYKNV